MMIDPSPKINKTFDAPLAARPIPIRTGSLSSTPSPARSRAAGLRQATSQLGMRGLQGISHLRSLTMPQKASSFGSRMSGSSSESSGSSGVGASRKGTRERPLVIGMPFFEAGEARDTATASLPPRFCALPAVDGLPVPLPALGPRQSAIRIPCLDGNQFNEFQEQALSVPEDAEPQEEEGVDAKSKTLCVRSDKADSCSSLGRGSDFCSADKRVGGIELWNVALNADHDALEDTLHNHPDPLSSNPTSEHDDDSEPSTPWAQSSPSAGFGTSADSDPYWQSSPTPAPKRRSKSIAPARVSAQMSLGKSPSSRESRHDQVATPCACEYVPHKLHREIANLRAGNCALMTIKAAHEETIALLRDNNRNHDNAIAKLTWQVQAKETEQVCIVENFCEEMSNRNRETESLREDKSYLMGEIEQLEKKIAKLDSVMGCSATLAAQSVSLPHRAVPSGAESIRDNDRAGIGAGEYAPSLGLKMPSSDDPKRGSGDLLTPTSMRSSLFLPRPGSSVSNRSLYAATLTTDVFKVPSTRNSTQTDSEDCLLKHQVRQSGPFQPVDVSSNQAESGRVHLNRHSQDGQIMTAQIVLAAKARLEDSLYRTQEKLAAAENHSQELQVQLADQASLSPQLSRPSAGTIPISSALMTIPDLPVLTYRRPSAVWIDRILTSFKYLGLLDFIQRDVPRPETSTWDATEVADWNSRRLRAVVLLKHAVDDEILEDVLHLCGRRDTAQNRRDFDRTSPALEDPHQLFTTITYLRRIISASPTDLSWLDRIEDADFDGIEGFTSLMLCIDKRHAVMYGTSANHYDALMPKLQETMARRFPELKRSAFAVDSAGSLPKKWRQLSVWMAKVGKARQISEAC